MTHALASYCLKPKISFKDQEDGETVLLLLRRHPITNLGWLLIFLGLLVLPFVIGWANFLPESLNLANLPLNYRLILILTGGLFAVLFATVNFLDWFFNVNLITNKRVVDMDYLNLLFFRASETNYAQVQDVTYQVSGLAQVIFNFGNVLIQTAGTEPNFELNKVPNPAGVYDLLTDLMGRRPASPDPGSDA